MKVLVADDEPVSRRLLESSLKRWQYEVVTAADGCEALQILLEPDPPKLVIFDWMMPGMDGLQLCREVRRRESEPYTYILLLTCKRNKRDVIEGLSAGADDYVIKPFLPQELKVRLRAGKRILCLQDQLINAREALRDLAMRDSLTQLWNRAAILQILDAELQRARRQEISSAFTIVDLDHFKRINDTYGHLEGDAVLRETARVMRSVTRPYDSIGRLGGEEFLIVLPGCDLINAVSHAERLREAISQIAIDTPMGPIRLTASMGVSTIEPEHELDSIALLRYADEALYRAKDQGRNRVEYFDPTMCVTSSEAGADDLDGRDTFQRADIQTVSSTLR